MVSVMDGQATHQLDNQVPDLPDCNLLLTDVALADGVRAEGGGACQAELECWGATLGRAELDRLAADVNRDVPRLRAFDRRGARVDAVDFHPGWARFLSLAFEQGMQGSAWITPAPGAHVARAAHYLMHGQVEAGSLCPITMTSAAIPLLAREPWFDQIRAQLAAREYDPADRPVARKHSMMVGMGLTEKQGGSDLRRCSSRAESVAGEPEWFRLTGHKWFFSSPMSDAHLMLACEGDAHSCFYVPRWLDDGTRNPVHIERLKDKLGNRSNSSAEIEFAGALGRRVGEAGRGIATLIEMASATRLDCVLGSAALLRRALVLGIHHARHRRAFGRLLADQPLMREVLADLVLESEAATALALRLAATFDHTQDAAEQALRRILTPAAKFWICKRTIAAVAECMEVWGGNGYIEDGPMARLYRESPVNSIWEGSGNVMCLDVLRAARHDPGPVGQIIEDIATAHADQPALQAAARRLLGALRDVDDALQAGARAVTRDLVLLVQADLLLRRAPAVLAQAFVHSRLAAPVGRVFGELPLPAGVAAVLLNRAWPA